jgi:hypothetical protein
MSITATTSKSLRENFASARIRFFNNIRRGPQKATDRVKEALA